MCYNVLIFDSATYVSEFEPGMDSCCNGKCCLHTAFRGVEQESDLERFVANNASDTRNVSSDQITSPSDSDVDVGEANDFDLETDLRRSKQRLTERTQSTDTTCTLRPMLPTLTTSQSGAGEILSVNNAPELVEFEQRPKTLITQSVTPASESHITEIKAEKLSNRSVLPAYETGKSKLPPKALDNQTVFTDPELSVLQLQPQASSSRSVIPASKSRKPEPRPRAVHEHYVVAAPKSRQRKPYLIDSPGIHYRHDHGIVEELPDPKSNINARQSHSAFNARARRTLKRNASVMQPTANASRR